MRKFLIILALLVISFSSSGCLLGLAALVRWDIKNYERQQKTKEIEAAKDEKCKTEKENRETEEKKFKAKTGD